MMSNIKEYFATSILVTFIGLTLAYFVGGVTGLAIAAMLSVLEVSLSFDNAIVNAKILKDMSDVWQKRFLTWGMLIAVFGMRLVFPVLIVSIVAGINPINAVVLASTDPVQYAAHLTAAHTVIMGFGGSFLAMVFWKYFIDETKDVHWIAAIEHPLTVLGKIEAIQAAIVLLSSYVFSLYIEHGAQEFVIASLFGVVTYIVTDGLKAFVGDGEESGDAAMSVAKSGFAAFMYLEVLDASFSFDGVIGALALTKNIVTIAIGLGIGAMFVRSLTILLVKKGTLAEYVFLEHSAFYAIGILALIMYVNTIHEIPEIVTGLIGVFVIAAGVISSIKAESKA